MVKKKLQKEFVMSP